MVLRQPGYRQGRQLEQRQAEWRTVGRRPPAQQCSGLQLGHDGLQGRDELQGHDERWGHGEPQGHDGKWEHGGPLGRGGDCAVTGVTLQCRDGPDHGIGHSPLRDGSPEQGEKCRHFMLLT